MNRVATNLPARNSKRFDTFRDGVQIFAVFFRPFRRAPISQQKAFFGRHDHYAETHSASSFGVFTVPANIHHIHSVDFGVGLFHGVGVHRDTFLVRYLSDSVIAPETSLELEISAASTAI